MPKTSSPTWKRVTPTPTAVTSPQTSQPTVKGGSPKTEHIPRPMRVLKSTGLTPAAWTRTWTSVGIGSGIAISSTRRTSGPPSSCWTIAFTDPILGQVSGRSRRSLRSLPLEVAFPDRGRHLGPARVARLPPAHGRLADHRPRHPGDLGGASLPGVRDHRLGLPHRADRRRRAGPAGRRLALRRGARRPLRPARSAAALPT